MVQLEDDKSFCTNETGRYSGSVVRDDEYQEEKEDTVVSDDESQEEKEDTLHGDATGQEEEVPIDTAWNIIKRLWFRLTATVSGILHIIFWAVKIFAIVLVSVCVFILTLRALETPSGPSVSPNQDLQSFVISVNKVLTEQSSIEDLPTDSYESYSAAYCLEGVSLQTTRDALSAGLKGVPQSVQAEIVSMALREGVTAKNTWRNSNADLFSRNKAHSYMSFYSTDYEPYDNGMDKYKTCVMVTGITFTVAELVAGFVETEEEYQVGTKLECSPGFFSPWCYSAPYYATRKIRTPAFKRRSLSLKEQKDLHNWMVKQAIESAEHLVAIGPSSDLTNERSLPGEAGSAWDWKPPKYDYEL